MTRFAGSARPLLALALGLVVLALAPGAGADTIGGLRPLASQPDPADLRPGLAVTYHYNLFNHVDEIPEWAAAHDGEAGAPIPMLNYNVGPDKVLTSDRDTGVGAVIEGLIHFPAAGAYELMVQSNDGVKLEIGGKPVYADPEVHVDRFSEPIALRIDTPGWYPLSMLYFEKKGTATLELYWLLPGAEDKLEFVPAKAFAHLPK